METLGETSQILGLEGNSGSEVPLLASAAEALKVVACLCPSSHLLPSALISLYFQIGRWRARLESDGKRPRLARQVGFYHCSH